MNKIVILFALIAFVSAAPVDEEEKPEPIAIIKSETTKNEDGSYKFEYEGADGTTREENAELVDIGGDHQSLKIRGSYRYYDANGDEVVVTYTADENGFVPIGTHISKEISDVAAAAKDYPLRLEDEFPKKD